MTYDVTRTEEARSEAVEIMCRVLDAIRAGMVWPNRGWPCRGCEYRRQCGASWAVGNPYGSVDVSLRLIP